MSTGDDADYIPAEQRARKLIDQQLAAAGWSVQHQNAMNLFATRGVAVREVTMRPGHGRVDYLLYVDEKAVGVIEAKPQGTTLTGVEWQSSTYADGLPPAVRLKALTKDGRLPFIFEASGTETHFTNGFDPDPRSRSIFHFPKPSTLANILTRKEADNPTWRGIVRHLPPLDEKPLRPAQIKAINGVEASLQQQRFDRSLIQMATGAGKTYTAVALTYRLLKYGGFNRVLFLVDRNNLATQTAGEFADYRTPDDGRKFTELYKVSRIKRGPMSNATNVAISTIQRVYMALRNQEVPDGDDQDIDAAIPDSPVSVAYNADIPPETFDLIIVDEAHRSIYGEWRGVLEYFDAHIVGLTATPGKQTFGFFRSNLVSEYTYPQSVADNVNVDFDIYRIKTHISTHGSTIDAGTVVPKVDKRTRAQRLEALDEDLEYNSRQLDRAVVAKDQIWTVLETFRDRLFTEIFPHRTTVPKTLIFAKNDAHAEDIVTAVRQVFGKGNDFAAKITYTARNAQQQLRTFRTSSTLRIAVTVDMIATGTDVKPLECVFFMRDVRSGQYFEQMKGRGARTIPSADFHAVTPDAKHKTRFVIVDAVGVTEHGFVEPPLNRNKFASLEGLLQKAANLTITEDETATLASRLAALEAELTAEERAELDSVAGGSVRDLIRSFVDAVDPDVQAKAVAGEKDPAAVRQQLIVDAVKPLADNPELRTRIRELRRVHHRVIDEVSADVLLDAHGVADTSKAKLVVESWAAYLDEHRAEITAIQLLGEAKGRRISFSDIQELADRIARPPYNWTPDTLWNAYIALETKHTGASTAHRTLTDLVSLVRYTVGVDDELIPYADKVHNKYAAWLTQQEQAGVTFTDTQRWWLDKIAEVIAVSAGVDVHVLDSSPFIENGGTDGALRDLGAGAGALIEELNTELTA
ncbi:type III restriction enzyme, res subunit [Mycobacteroides abscessus subsp. abscessus]|uniref:type I restriction endonuclease subunit R n=1 Tax=Mycobacteroides abscessus TaxID=36809 RepID=UPI000927819D|nr:type I restriction endonuclease subunit R [Mycobacteroides abscessus]SHT53359.1 type III restriction enzyme, res subunit [Mycobacteroides abscessus subsp. abscessus]SHW39370.1 type III restriction enzyme, res subunit [Mycobacteroides abscessus subsp. abscessus]SIF85264.1 type III restriction enzyme, res subunit [Mycobacteroides abscessus subsp. abscessus]SKD17538.1 type III restriction enzyme, res subunit [Mycobacteroides abscessus subsp. abscessus]SKM27605.1 type III restriction enzyme, re